MLLLLLPETDRSPLRAVIIDQLSMGLAQPNRVLHAGSLRVVQRRIVARATGRGGSDVCRHANVDN